MPSAFNPATTSAADAHKSLAMTGAPRSFSTPLITAVDPSRSTCAPMRFNSATCITLRANIFRDDADAVGRGKQRAHLRLHIRRETGIGLGHQLERHGRAIR